MRTLAIALIFSLSLVPGAAAQGIGSFSGLPVVQLSLDGRTARVVEPLTFIDPAGTNWTVPKNTIVDGASIPRPFWALIGGPWEGAYRDASIIHDHYCVTRSRSWQAVHRVFYDGMLARKVNPVQAKIMYYAVYKFGPRWSRVVKRVRRLGSDGQVRMVSKPVIIDQPAIAYDAARAEADQRKIETGDLSLEQIEALADES